MLKDLVIDLTENYHDLGHNGSSVDAMMDSVAGMGHRIKHGHDAQGLIEAYQLEGIEGIGLWFDHMTKDFTSPAGIPLPFSEAIYNVSGMQMNTAIDWLTVNAFDAGSLITQEIALKLSKNNPKAYKIAFLLGSGIGIIDDNPLIVVANTLRLLKQGKLHRLVSDSSIQFLNRTAQIAGRVCMGTAAITLSAGVVGINIPENIEELGDNFDLVEGLSDVADILDGVVSFGVMLFVSKGIKGLANEWNKELVEEVQLIEEDLAMFKSLKQQVSNGASLSVIALLMDDMKQRNLLPNKQLLLGDIQ